MRSAVFVLVVLLSGAGAGAVQGAVNLVTVEPYLDEAIGIENQSLFESGEESDTPEFRVEYGSYRAWQKGGQILGTTVLGLSMGSLFGIVYALSRDSLPGGHDVKKAMVLAGVMWLVIFLVPFLKYPANPPGVGDADTVELRASLHLVLTAVSGISALLFYLASRKLHGHRKLLSAAGYGILMGFLFVAMPGNPDATTVPADLIDGFRAMSVVAVSSYWFFLPLFLGILWSRLRPDRPLAAAP